MQLRRVGGLVEQFSLAIAGMLFTAGCGAQPALVQPCEGVAKGTCAEVLLRYHEQPVKSLGYEPAKIEILDAKTKAPIGNACQVCDPKVDSSCKTPCKELHGATLQDASSIILLQSHKSPGCFYFCSGGWCRWVCF